MASLDQLPSSSPTLAAADSTDGDASKELPSRYDTKAELEAVINNPKAYKKFIKRTKCAECGLKCMEKRFSASSFLIVNSMIDTFWCSDCGRLTCEKHRAKHTCERQDFIEAKRRAKTGAEIAAEVKQAEDRKRLAEDEAEALKQAAALEAAEGYAERKARRKVLASKAGHIAAFLQRQSVTAFPTDRRKQQELLDCYTVASRVHITLWNEFDRPSVSGTHDEAWEEAKQAYLRGSELTGMVIALPEGESFDVRNPWDPQPQPQPQPRGAAE